MPETWHRDFAACWQRSGLLALNLASIFEKFLHRKTFVCLRLVLGIPPESGSARLGHIPSLPWESQLPLKPCISLQPSDFEGNCDSLRFSPRFLLHFIVQFHLLRKCGLLAHTSPAFLKNCWSKKLFICLRLVAYSQYQKNNSNKKAEYVFSVLCFCLLCDIRNPKSCICNNLNQGIICNRMG